MDVITYDPQLGTELLFGRGGVMVEVYNDVTLRRCHITRRVRISMDGKGRFLDNLFIERLWRSLKYEEVYIKAYGSVAEARQSIGGWLGFYNEQRPHQALGYRTPRVVHEGAACEYVDNACVSGPPAF